MQTSNQKFHKERWLWGAVLLLLWGGAGALFYWTHGDLSVQELLRYQPENKLLAALAMCGLFLLKSVDFLLHSGVLYALDGILFPLPYAFAMNLLGIVILAVVPYEIGRALGAPLMDSLRDKYPKLRDAEALVQSSDFLLTFLMRLIGVPLCAVGMYLGARRMDRRAYLLGSVLGLIPSMIPYTLMGDNATDPSSPLFVGAAAGEVFIHVAALAVFFLLQRKKKSA